MPTEVAAMVSNPITTFTTIPNSPQPLPYRPLLAMRKAATAIQKATGTAMNHHRPTATPTARNVGGNRRSSNVRVLPRGTKKCSLDEEHDNPTMAPISRGLGVILVLWGILVLAWCVGVALSDDWNSDVEPIHVVLVALTALASAASGAVGAKQAAVEPIGLGLSLAVASFLGVILIVGGTG
jgi:hypothetical protein